MFRFASPAFLFLLGLIPLLAWWYFYRNRGRGGTLRFSYLGVVKEAQPRSAARGRHSLFIVRLIALCFLIVALARPQAGAETRDSLTEGIDIILAMDISGSMMAEDIKPNRVEAAKQVAEEFVKGRTNDRIGLVIFSGEAYSQCPLTLDYGVVLSFLNNLRVGMIEDGTALGNGLATAVNRLRGSKARSKVVILLTDGRNNRGEIDPISAGEAAQAFGVKVYTIGAGTHGTALYPVEDPLFGKRYVPMQVDVDDQTLMRIADLTGGKYFRATDRGSLEKIYSEIDRMERTKIEVKEYTRYSELFYYFAGIGLLLVLAEIVPANTRYRKLP
jgi:Ca-activated chloride channel family protein